ncbi:MAG: hypothetical protein M1827_007462 [Pycnora praestabilis]|nr:MAG: hypothetical protein M1827_007462 [Pycnora praestabilis]
MQRLRTHRDRLAIQEFHSGSIETVPGFEPKLSAKVISGSDWLYFDADQGHIRVNVKGMARTEDGVAIGFIYSGPIELNEYTKPFFAEDPKPKTIPFGSSSSLYATTTKQLGIFKVGDPKYKFLENSAFCSNGRFIFEGGQLTAESRISRTIPSTAMD